MSQRQCYFDPDGNPITLEQWNALLESPRRPTRLSRVGTRHLKTVYLGLVEPMLPGTRLFGSAVWEQRNGQESEIVEVELYDTRDEAYDGHARHRQAMEEGFHCDGCRTGAGHP